MIYIAKLARRLARLREGTTPLLMVTSLLLVLSCSAGEPTGVSTGTVSDSEPEGESIVLSPRQVTLEANQRLKFFAYASDLPGSSQVTSVEWTATGGSISPDGEYTASVAGDFRVVGKKRGWHKNHPDTSTVIVVPPQPTVVEVVASPTGGTVVGGQRQQFSAQGRLSDGSSAAIGVTWTTNGGSIDAGGLFTASNVSGTYHVIAVHTTTGVADTVPVTVKGVRQVAISPTSSSLGGGSSLQYGVTGTLEDGTTATLTTVGYTTNGGYISSGGFYTAPTTAGSYRVTSTLVPPTGTTLSADAAVTVVASSNTSYPNEPANSTPIFEKRFSALPGTHSDEPFGTSTSGSLYVANAMGLASDATAPASAPSVLRTTFPAGLVGGTNPVKWTFWEGTDKPFREMYMSVWMKVLGSDFENHIVQQKLFYHASGGDPEGNNDGSWGFAGEGSVTRVAAMNMYMSNSSCRTCSAVKVYQNVTTRRLFTVGRWHRVEVYQNVGTVDQANGIARMWIDGVLVINRTNLKYLDSATNYTQGFYRSHWSPVWGGTGGTKAKTDYIDIDHIYVSGRP